VNIFQIAFLLFISFTLTQQGIVVTVTPDNPEPGEKVTVYAEAGDNVSGITIQVCYGDICLQPSPMEKVGDKYKYSFYVNETTKVDLHFKIIENDMIRWDNSTSFKVEKKGNGTPGFMAVATICAIATVFLLRKRITLK